jgi:cytochrome c oxidase assembly protein subunit 15
MLSLSRRTLQNAANRRDPSIQSYVISTHRSSDAIAVWLTLVAALVFAMVVVGGVTRLTRSGLSITEWNPVIGAIPPLSTEQWQTEFEKYQQTPEYRHVNSGMSLDSFKQIYLVEWAHRLLGRVIGFAVIVPLIYFAVRRQLSKPLVLKLFALFILGGLQGALGWFMVKSGLVDIPRVSPYRLTAHLALAVTLYAWLVWMVLDLKPPLVRNDHPRARGYALIISGLVVLMILAGGFVAGTKAGFAFNTFPLMNGAFVPPGLFAMQPTWVNFFENVATVQFDHRMLAYVLLFSTATFWWWGRHANLALRTRRIMNWLLAALCVQVGLGIATLLLIVPVWLGALHQAGALAVFTIALRLNHDLAKSR